MTTVTSCRDLFFDDIPRKENSIRSIEDVYKLRVEEAMGVGNQSKAKRGGHRLRFPGGGVRVKLSFS